MITSSFVRSKALIFIDIPGLPNVHRLFEPCGRHISAGGVSQMALTLSRNALACGQKGQESRAKPALMLAH